MIDIRNISKSYKVTSGWNKSNKVTSGWNLVLDDISVCFPSDRNIGILGLNGAGKSTLLRLIGGVEAPDRGEIVRDVNISWPIGFSGGILPDMTGREATRFITRIYGADIRETEDYVLDFSELGRYFDMEVKTYSSGMRARLGFSISMAMDFDCYLVDEVTAVGDARFRERYHQEFVKRQEHSCVLMVSHQPSTIKQFCDMVAVLFNGKITLYDSVDEGMRMYQEMIDKVKK